jgi:hypothetical protein
VPHLVQIAVPIQMGLCGNSRLCPNSLLCRNR